MRDGWRGAAPHLLSSQPRNLSVGLSSRASVRSITQHSISKARVIACFVCPPAVAFPPLFFFASFLSLSAEKRAAILGRRGFAHAAQDLAALPADLWSLANERRGEKKEKKVKKERKKPEPHRILDYMEHDDVVPTSKRFLIGGQLFLSCWLFSALDSVPPTEYSLYSILLLLLLPLPLLLRSTIRCSYHFDEHHSVRSGTILRTLLCPPSE